MPWRRTSMKTEWGYFQYVVPPIYLHWIFPILQFEISSLKNWIFSQFEIWNQLDIFPSWNLIFWARVKCLMDLVKLFTYSLSTIYRDIHYQFLVWWIIYSHCTAVNQRDGNLGIFHLCSLWYDYINYPNLLQNSLP